VSEPKPILLHGKPVGGGAFPLICTPLVGRTRDAVLGEVDAVLPKKPDVLEWRVDFFEALGDTAHVLDTARAIRDRVGPIPVMFTRRSSIEGGEKIALTESQVVQLYVDVCGSRLVDLIDYETVNAAEDFRRLRAVSREHGIALIGSYHNFQRTPDAAALAAKFALAHQLDADIAKVAVMPKGPPDVLTLLGATYDASQALPIPLISMSMGPYGSLSRMVGFVYGSALTWAVGKSSSAPGQLPIEDLRAVLATVRKTVLGG
jgi:3-dehydroquinate dehydratase-1